MPAERCASYYNATINQESDYPKLESDIRVDVAIVGGGFTGVATALELSEKGYKVALIEANKVAWGQPDATAGR